ncbi:MAG: undecaprenyl/decaprenyl-phosphate alpha-N-acetylglucosaminyl 1-phosphate transferase [Bacilli bacterium]|nr:undecaprenyl/decaprenyl-phosphate alpha-N-acetylglucosaminyl 1-phosphate transferase [Bacilli bacterium]
MNLFINGYNIFIIVLVSFLFTLFLTPIVRWIAMRIGAMDKPNKRKVQDVPIASMGGLAIFLTFLLSYMIFAPIDTRIISVMIGAFIIILTGIIDDINPLRAREKLFGQLISALVVTIYGGVAIEHIQVFGHIISFGIFSYPITIFFIVAIMNAIDLADGLDGLAAGTTTIYFVTTAIIGYFMSDLAGLNVILCLILAGSCLGFLMYNFAPASIYMGDTGSLFLGYMISIIALVGFKSTTITSLIIPIVMLFVPIIDTLLAMERRLLKGQSVGDADREHLHHQLLKKTKSVTKTVLIMYVINGLFSIVSVLYVLGNKKLSIILYCILLALFIILIFTTDVLFEHKKKDKDEN